MPPSFYATYANAGGLNREVERLRAQARIGWESERARLATAGLRDGLTVAEIGCGPAVFADLLLARYPETQYTGIDYDRSLLDHALRRGFAREQPNARLVCASADNLSIADSSCDFAFARFVYQHLRHHEAATAELERILKPGGTVAIIDTDDAFGVVFDPPIKALGVVGVKVALAQALSGGDRRIGRKVPGFLRAAGFADVSFESVLLASDALGLEPFRAQFKPEYLMRFVDTGLISMDEWTAARDGLEQFFNTPGALVIEQRLIACGVKPKPG